MSDVDSENEFDLENQNFIGAYIGERSEDGKRDGIGKAVLPNHNQFVGDYKDGLRHGSGVLQYKNGAQYDGEWKNGLKNGKGKLSYPDGSWYAGKWLANKKHGFGKYFYANGDYYDGYWKDDQKHCLGIYKFHEADILVKGTWLRGELKGPVEIIYPDSRYHGFWNKNSPVGEGVFTFDMQHMLTGHAEKASSDKRKSTSERSSVETSEAGEANEIDNRAYFKAHEIQIFNSKLLPEPPVLLQDQFSSQSLCSQPSSHSTNSGSPSLRHSTNSGSQLSKHSTKPGSVSSQTTAKASNEASFTSVPQTRSYQSSQ